MRRMRRVLSAGRPALTKEAEMVRQGVCTREAEMVRQRVNLRGSGDLVSSCCTEEQDGMA